jgi:hypothetical protein
MARRRIEDTCLKVTCHLASPVVGDLPFLDAILEGEMARRDGSATRLRRDQPCPPYGQIHIPMLRRTIGGLAVPCCSAPIARADRVTVEHFAKRLATEHAGLLAPKKRLVVATGNATFKSYRLPLQVQVIHRIVWFAIARRRPVKQLLRSVRSVGRKRSMGYGRVAEWVCERIDNEWSWFVRTEAGPVLMRPLPFCADLPGGLLGAREDFGAVQSPMWHPDRFVERVVPC